MADVASALFARLSADADVSALAGTRIYPTIVPQGKALPYVRYQVVSDPRPEHLRGYDGARVTRVQVDCFAAAGGGGYLAAREIAEKIIAAMAAPAEAGGVRFGRCKAEGPRDLGEDVPGLGFVHRASIDLLVEHRLA